MKFDAPIFYANKPKGASKVHEMNVDAAPILGLNMEFFRGGHAWRHFFITAMVNDPAVSSAESMRAARHNSVSANISYQADDERSEANKINCLIRHNAPLGWSFLHLLQLSPHPHHLL